MLKRFVWLSSATVFCAVLGWYSGSRVRTDNLHAPVTPAPRALETAPTSTSVSGESAEVIRDRLKADLAKIKTIPSSGEQMVATCRLLAQLPTEHLPAAIDLMGAGSISQARGVAIEEWAVRDFEAARAWMEALPPAERARAVASIGRVWAKRDPSALLEWVKGLEGAERKSTVAALGPGTIGLAAGSDLEEALRLLREGGSGEYQEAELLKAFGRRSPGVAAGRILNQPPGRNRAEALGVVVEELARVNPTEARAFWQGLTDAALSQSIVANLLSGWCEKDPKAAIEFLADLPATKENLATLPVLLGAWSDRDPGAALAWLDQQPADSFGYDAYSTVLSKLDKDDPEAAMRRMEERKAAGKPTSEGAYGEALRMLADKDSAETAFARLETLQKLGIADAYAAALASRFPERVTEWALQQAEGKRGNLFWRIAHQLRGEGGSKAVEFAMKMPMDEETISIMREMAFEHLISHTDQVLPLYARLASEEEARRLMKRHAYTWLHGVSLVASDRAKRWLAGTPIFTADEKQALSTPPAQRQ